jgi:hypothetical protein
VTQLALSEAADARERRYPALPPVERPAGRSFIHFSRAWYADACRPLPGDAVDEVHLSDGRDGFRISWHAINGCLAPRLEAYDDSWRALYAMDDVLALLHGLHDQNVTPEQLCTELARLGFVDVTPLEQS